MHRTHCQIQMVADAPLAPPLTVPLHNDIHFSSGIEIGGEEGNMPIKKGTYRVKNEKLKSRMGTRHVK